MVVYILVRIAPHLDESFVPVFDTAIAVGLTQAFEKNVCSYYFNFIFFITSDQYQCNL